MHQKIFAFLIIASFNGLLMAGPDVKVRETQRAITVTVSAPVPEEVESDSQAKALSREAAIALGQTHILNHILQKKTRSRKTLAEAEIPSLHLQNRIRAMVKGVQVKKTWWKDNLCWVTLALNKRELKAILREN